jgi:ferredoxin
VKYKIEIDRDECIACGMCYTIDPEHFEGDPEGKSKVIGGVSNSKSTGTFDDTKNEDAKTAASTCPVGVIAVNTM